MLRRAHRGHPWEISPAVEESGTESMCPDQNTWKSQQPGSPKEALVLLKNSVSFYCWCNQIQILFLGKVSFYGGNSGFTPHYPKIYVF